MVRSLDIKTLPAKGATRSRRMPPLNGSLALDPDFLARVHSRFAGEVVEVGTVADPDGRESSPGGTAVRVVRFGDKVEKGQLLAVVWSKDLGEKKSELMDALSQLRINRDTLNRLKTLTEGGDRPPAVARGGACRRVQPGRRRKGRGDPADLAGERGRDRVGSG